VIADDLVQGCLCPFWSDPAAAVPDDHGPEP
jgi:hypothetical protein